MSVDANLAAGVGGRALISVNASLAVILQLEPRATSALVADFQVLTLLGAATLLLVQALVDETVQLIRAITTVIIVVTEQIIGDALLIVAEVKCVIALALWARASLILGGFIRLVVAVKLAITLPQFVAQTAAVSTTELIGATSGVLTIRGFIRTITTVIIMITHKMFWDALPVVAHKLPFITSVVIQTTSSHGFISPIRTISVSITQPALWDTQVGVWTLEGSCSTSDMTATVVFIRAIATVICTIAHPLFRDAPMIVAFKLHWEAELIAVGLILSILTVILFITSPCHGNASPTRAGKVVSWALRFSCAWTILLI